MQLVLFIVYKWQNIVYKYLYTLIKSRNFMELDCFKKIKMIIETLGQWHQ